MLLRGGMKRLEDLLAFGHEKSPQILSGDWQNFVVESDHIVLVSVRLTDSLTAVTTADGGSIIDFCCYCGKEGNKRIGIA